jgi:catechol O-methyltransferase
MNSSPATHDRNRYHNSVINVFSDSWMTMEKPVREDFYAGAMSVSYGNLFESYAVEDVTQPQIPQMDSISEAESGSTRTASIDTMVSSPSFSTDPKSLGKNKRRHAQNGIFTFKENGEYELMMQVQRGLPKDFGKISPVESANLILSAVDTYCLEEQWMYHIGREKGATLKEFLADCIAQHQAKNTNRPLIIVEIGTYCGYSAILLAKSVQEIAPNLEFQVYTTEVNTQNIMVASSMILMSKFQKSITVMPFQPSLESLSDLLKTKGLSQIDFLFLDHAKDMYLEDLQELEHNSFVKEGTYAAADNVVFSRLDGYRNHVFQLQNRGITTTRLAKVSLEYSDGIKDGIGKYPI